MAENLIQNLVFLHDMFQLIPGVELPHFRKLESQKDQSRTEDMYPTCICRTNVIVSPLFQIIKIIGTFVLLLDNLLVGSGRLGLSTAAERFKSRGPVPYLNSLKYLKFRSATDVPLCLHQTSLAVPVTSGHYRTIQ